MKIIDIPGGQGSQAWHEHRRTHWNASDAPAMMGCSPYKTRNALLHELHTGLPAEVDADKQRLFDDGHRSEALARPIAEKILGEDLYPIIVANGRLSASLDGATLDGSVNFEHKRLNNELHTIFTTIPDPGDGRHLPLCHRVQMEHQLHCSGAKQTLFMASEWGAEGTLVREYHCIYLPDLELRAKVLAGWAQFEQDLAAYTPAEAPPVVTAAPQEHLPAVSVQLNGSLAVVSNLAPFGVALRAFVERIPKRPSTDQEFADTEAACKRLKEAEERLQQAEDSALASMADVEAMRRMVAEFRELARTTRLASEKLVKQRKEQIREEEVRRGADALRSHIVRLNERLGGAYMPIVPANFAGVIKGLKTLDSVRNAIDTELARAKIEANEVADKIDANLKTIAAAGAPTLFPDKATLALKEPDDLAAIIAQRLAAESKRQEAERERIREQERARAAESTAQQDAPASKAPAEAAQVGGQAVADGHAEGRPVPESRHAAVLHAMSPIAPVGTDEPKLSTKTMERIAQIVVLLEEGAKPTSLHDVLVVLCKLAYLDGQLSVLKPKEPA